MVSFETVHKHP